MRSGHGSFGCAKRPPLHRKVKARWSAVHGQPWAVHEGKEGQNKEGRAQNWRLPLYAMRRRIERGTGQSARVGFWVIDGQ